MSSGRWVEQDGPQHFGDDGRGNVDRQRASQGGQGGQGGRGEGRRWVEQDGPQHFGDNAHGHNIGHGYVGSSPRFYDPRSGDQRGLERAQRAGGGSNDPYAWSPYGLRSSGQDRAAAAVESHRGKGPKGFRRSDDRLREDVCEALADDHEVDATDIEVSVKDGEVTLSGMVKSRQMKREATDVVENVRGVTDVHNLLRWQAAAAAAAASSAENKVAPSNGTRDDKRAH